MISVAEARERILAHVRPLPAEQIPLSDGLGRVLARDVVARRTQPPAAVSAMDGYAVRAADVTTTPVTLKVVGYAPAGSAYDTPLQAGETVRIFTGAPVPDNADAIVIQENTELEGNAVVVQTGAAPGTFIRPAGLDFSEGDTVLSAGRVLSARDIGLAAAMNVPWLMVTRQPQVAILSTGDEVVMPGDPIGPNQIVSSNALALGALAAVFGARPLQLGIAPDDKGALAEMAAGAAGSDIFVTTGGVSTGDHDLVRDVLGEHGMRLDFWRIAMRPGKPLMVGENEGTLVLGLPGNPVSTVVCALVFLQPALAAMQRRAQAVNTTIKARLAVPAPANDQREDYLRSVLSRNENGEMVVEPFERQDSAMMALLARSDCFVIRPPHAPAAEAGEIVEVLLLPAGMASA